MTWLDVSRPIRAGMAVYEGDPPVVIEQLDTLAGGVCNLSGASLSLHTGTHIDAPVHFIEGAGGAEAIDLDACIGPCLVVDARDCVSHLAVGDIARLVPEGTKRVIFRTSNGSLWDEDVFRRDFIALREDAAAELVRRGVRLAGIDYLSIAPYDDPAPAHVRLLEAGVVILEGLDLRAIEPGPYELLCLPLLITGADGAPARALLRYHG